MHPTGCFTILTVVVFDLFILDNLAALDSCVDQVFQENGQLQCLQKRTTIEELTNTNSACENCEMINSAKEASTLLKQCKNCVVNVSDKNRSNNSVPMEVGRFEKITRCDFVASGLVIQKVLQGVFCVRNVLIFGFSVNFRLF
jgi:Tfp pilus assembly protein PilV